MKTEKELLEWAAKLIDYLHDYSGPDLNQECHEWFKEYWKIKNDD